MTQQGIFVDAKLTTLKKTDGATVSLPEPRALGFTVTSADRNQLEISGKGGTTGRCVASKFPVDIAQLTRAKERGLKEPNPATGLSAYDETLLAQMKN
ncbi:MAG: hypothetical protein U5Q16_10315 [Gammaproteobacteria bacterium]|nr:hypothetical protein [Gammaproteobacteria bacterium]